MEIDDPAVPALRHLVGPSAADVVGAAVRAAGGQLHQVRISQVQYRPGSDVVVRYRADVTWADGRRFRRDTLLAAAGGDGPLPGTVPVEATIGEDGILVASVWRWPFDPTVVGLEAAVTPGCAADLLDPCIGPTASIDVVAYRPTERAVVRAVGAEGRVAYLKVLPPTDVPALVNRHERLLDAGLPVPQVLAGSAELGIVVLAELPGPTLRERIKGDLGRWPRPEAIAELVDRVHALPPVGPSARGGRVADGRGHARLLAAVAPHLAAQLDALAQRFAAEAGAVRARSGSVVHGDLHEGQLIVDDDGAITGLLDIDDLGTGDPVDDLATVIGHLHFRAWVLDAGPGDRAGRLRAHAARLRYLAAERVGDEAIDVAVAAVLVGLATGPFRIQRAAWATEVEQVVADAVRIAGLAVPEMRNFSARPHESLIPVLERGTRQRDIPIPRRKEAS